MTNISTLQLRSKIQEILKGGKPFCFPREDYLDFLIQLDNLEAQIKAATPVENHDLPLECCDEDWTPYILPVAKTKLVQAPDDPFGY